MALQVIAAGASRRVGMRDGRVETDTGPLPTGDLAVPASDLAPGVV